MSVSRAPKPMLAQLRRELPVGAFIYEPKWDGLRCIAAAAADGSVALVSRHGRPLGRYFPEIVAAVAARGRALMLDGELLIAGAGGFDFAALLSRVHPSATRVAQLSRSTPASFVAFDLIGLDDESLADRPFAERRARLVELLGAARGTLIATPATDDVDVARLWLSQFTGRGIDGVVAKARDLRYQPGKRAMIKVKRERTADCVVAGFRWFGDRRVVGSLLLGLYDGDELRHVGVTSSFSGARRAELLDEIRGDVVPLAGHPWERGFGLGRSPMGRLPGAAGRWDPTEMTQDWIPLRATRVVEVAYDHLDGQRFRHPARFVRWRPDREARSCAFEQLDEPARERAVHP
ncbi:MAG: ATP-dependent DNA ligase [Myxococcales bacterium]|nr:ATP-dependent DNA ligase [Myxococcales bacterium]